MFTQAGIACLAIWLMNIGFIISEVLKYRSEDDTDVQDVVQRFLMNTPLERMIMIQQISQMNPLFFISGVVMIMFGIFI